MKVVRDKNIQQGTPVIEGTRITVTTILACLRDGMTFQQIQEDYGVTRKSIEDVLNYSIRIINKQ